MTRDLRLLLSGRENRGAVAVVFAVMMLTLVLAIGGAIDFNRAVRVRGALQGIVDDAATAGANAYSDATEAAVGSASATTFMNNSTIGLPSNTGVTFTVTPGTATSSGGAMAGYTMTVTAKTGVNSTFLGSVLPSIPVTVTATANNPLLNATADTGNWSSFAADTNVISWYPVPKGNGLPTADTLTPLFSNKTASSGTTHTFAVSATKRIGFALTNTTANYVNQYGAGPGSTHVFYSHIPNPSSSANGYNSGNNPRNVNGVNSGGGNNGNGNGNGGGNGNGNSNGNCPNCGNGNLGNNCSLQTQVMSGATLPVPAAGVCFTAPMQYTATTCRKLTKKKVLFSWNDMGGGVDDKDYNDAQYTFTCDPLLNTGATTVVLTK